MLMIARELFQAQEIRSALHSFWREALAWPAAACATAWVAFAFGPAAGFGAVALAALTRLRPSVTRLTSPDGRRTLVDLRWSFGSVVFMAALVLCAAAVRLAWIPGSPWTALAAAATLVPAASAAILTFVVPVLMSTWFPWALHLVRVREDGHVKTWYVRVRISYYAETEYLWLPDGQGLLVAQSDEDDCWYLYVFDPEAEGPGAHYPYNAIVGHYPNLRRVTLDEARARVAKFLRDAETVQQGDAAGRQHPATSNYEDLCRRFFVWFNPQCVNH